MAKKINYRLVRKHRSYSASELAKLLNVHIATVRLWRKQGLEPIAESSYPYLFLGEDVKLFLSKRQKSRKCPLMEGQMYCPRCRQAVSPITEKLRFTFTNKRMGKNNEQVIIKGVCGNCGCKINRFSSKNQLENSIWQEKFIQAQNRLSGITDTFLNTHFLGDDDNEF